MKWNNICGLTDWSIFIWHTIFVHIRWCFAYGLFHEYILFARISWIEYYVYIWGKEITNAIQLTYKVKRQNNKSKWFNLKCSQYLEARFDRRLRMFGAVMFTVANVSYLKDGFVWHAFRWYTTNWIQLFQIAYLPIVVYVPALAFNQGFL